MKRLLFMTFLVCMVFAADGDAAEGIEVEAADISAIKEELQNNLFAALEDLAKQVRITMVPATEFKYVDGQVSESALNFLGQVLQQTEKNMGLIRKT